MSYFRNKKVGREGFEPPKAAPTDLQSAPFNHSGTSPFYKELYSVFVMAKIEKILKQQGFLLLFFRKFVDQY
jgi:hypothetical protein